MAITKTVHAVRNIENLNHNVLESIQECLNSIQSYPLFTWLSNSVKKDYQWNMPAKDIYGALFEAAIGSLRDCKMLHLFAFICNYTFHFL